MNSSMAKHALLGAVLVVLGPVAKASTIAVIDSGLDVDQKDLFGRVWLNPIDSTENGIDEDHNGFTDDIHGWNFAENSNKLLDRSFSNLYDADIVRFFEVQARSLKGSASSDDTTWAKEKVKDKEFIKKLMTYGNYAHGTHVSGITARQGDGLEVIGIKLIPTKSPLGSVEEALDGLQSSVRADLAAGKDLNWILKGTIKLGLTAIAKLQSKALTPIGQYVNAEKADVANGSFGMGPNQAKMLVTPVLKLALGGQEPAPELLDEMSSFFLKQVVSAQATLVTSAPNTLFVFAAGNDGSNNDVLPTAPASIKQPNVISVAAVFEDGRLAPFSNFGESVDIAAPGVAIDSTVPDNHRLALSGTSQASPHVAGAAAAVKAANPKLDPASVKVLLMGTVDERTALKGKVKSSGVLNLDRAVEAAHLSIDLPLSEAITKARESIASKLPAESAFAEFGEPDMSLWLNLQPVFLR